MPDHHAAAADGMSGGDPAGIETMIPAVIFFGAIV